MFESEICLSLEFGDQARETYPRPEQLEVLSKGRKDELGRDTERTTMGTYLYAEKSER